MAKKSMLREVLSKPKYDKDEFIIPASDSKGHGTLIGLRCMSGYLRTINEILASKKFPYKTVSDVLRHAIHVHVHWLKEIEPEIRTRLGFVDAALELVRVQQTHMEFLSMIKTVEDTVNKLAQDGMKAEAKKLVKSLLSKIEEDPVDDVWRRKFTTELKSRFGHLFPEWDK